MKKYPLLFFYLFIYQFYINHLHGMERENLEENDVEMPYIPLNSPFTTAIEMESDEILRINAISDSVYDIALQLDRQGVTAQADAEKHKPLPNLVTVGNRSYKVHPFYSVTGWNVPTCMGGIYREYENERGIDTLYIAVRGTMVRDGAAYLSDIVTDLTFRTVNAPQPLEGKIHKGFNETAESLYPSFQRALSLMVDQDLDWKSRFKIKFSGHSLGAALTTLIANKFAAEQQMPHTNQIHVVLGSSPLIGDRDFVRSLYRYIPMNNILHFCCGYDVVTYVPPAFLGFQEVGVQIETLALERIAERGVLSVLGELPLLSTVTATAEIGVAGMAGIALPLAMRAHSLPPAQTVKRAFNDLKENLSSMGVIQAGSTSILSMQRSSIIKFLKWVFVD